MKLDDILFGSRSGIQKAIRRSDLSLARTCFEVLWSNSVHRNWLKWRLPVLVMEEAWYYGGELSSFLSSKPDDVNKWKEFIYYLTLIPKNKDAGAVMSFAKHPSLLSKEESGGLIEDVRKWMAVGDEKGIDAAVQGLSSVLLGERSPCLRMKRGCGDFQIQSVFWWYAGDRFAFLSAMLLIKHIGINQKVVLRTRNESVGRYTKKNGAVPPKILKKIPWYSFDMHTQAGIIAMRSF